MRVGVFGIAAAMLLLPAMEGLAAGHGRAGLWSVTTKVNMPNMPQMTAEQRAQMKAAGVNMSGSNTFMAQHCVSPQEAALDKPPAAQSQRGCTMTNYKLAGGTMSADLKCTGDNVATGHMRVSYSSNTHYSGSVQMTAVQDGQNVSMTNTFEGKWMGANCGSVTH